MKCSLCGFEFKEEDGQAACKGCTLSRSCGLIKCPNCGYEIPKESGIIKKLKRWEERIYEDKR